ncbi:unnamed protein product [Fusarium graminearum]|nr:unnamed protein product [Fusarium graminearum]
MATSIGNGPPSMAETTGDRLIAVLVVVVFSVLVSLLMLVLRIWCRWSIRSLGWDDFAAMMSLICITIFGSGILALIPLGLSDPTGQIPVDKIPAFYKCAYITIFFYGQALFWAKMSFVLLYYRIVSLSYWRWIYIGAMVFLVLWNICVILVFFLTCIPMATIWDPTVKGKCVKHALELGYACAGISIFTDLAVAVLPLPFIWNLNLRRPHKIALSGVFLLGCFSISLAIVRIRWADMWSTTTWDIVRPQLWGLAEVTSALICACIPTFKPLLVRLNSMRPCCERSDQTPAVQNQRSDDEVGLTLDTVTKVGSQSQESHDEDPHRALAAKSYGTNTYIEAKPHPWGKASNHRWSWLYGPGALYCWYLLLASVLMHWFFCYVNDLTPDFSSDLLGALAYPVFATTDLLLQSVRMMGKDDRALAIYCLAFPDSLIWGSHSFSDTPLDMNNIPPEVLDLGQRVIDIIGPYRVSWTAGLFLYVLLFGLRRSGISSESKYTSTRSPYLVMRVALCYILLSLIIFYFSIADPGMGWTLFFWEGSRQAMLIGTWIFTALLIMVVLLSMTRLVQTLGKGRNAETKEILHSIMWGFLPGAAVMAVAFGLIMYFGMTIVPDVAIQLTERDQLATLMVGIVTWVYAMLDVCYCYFEPPNAAGEVVDKLP